MIRRARAVGVAAVLVVANAQATTPGALYVGQSLLCRQRATGARCELWLNADGRYDVFYDSLRASVARGVAGPFRYEGRQGAYAVTAAPGGVQLCLRPDQDAAPRGSGVGVALFHDAGCVVLPVHPIGEVFPLDFAGQSYSLVLAQGR